eukprot:jgi/Mesvir1/15172/Mv08191-RA.1
MESHLGMTELVERVQGGTPQLQGTWLHPSLVWHVAAWISPVFSVAAMDWADTFFHTPNSQKGCMIALTEKVRKDAAAQPLCILEADVRDKIAEILGAETEVPVGDTGMRADIVSRRFDMLLEVKEVSRWAEAIGQLVVYSRHFDPKLAKVLVVFDREGSDIRDDQIDFIEFHLQGMDIMVCSDKYFSVYH